MCWATSSVVMENITLQAESTAAKITDYHAKYFAHELTRRFPTDI